MAEQVYRQCKLQRGAVVDTAFIPNELAKVGKVLSIRLDGKWSSGWRVLETYVTRTAAELSSLRNEQRERGCVLEDH